MDALYGLSFELRGPKKVPTLIISIPLESFEKLMPIWQGIVERTNDEDLRKYFGRLSPLSAKEGAFGYRKCAVVENGAQRKQIVFPIRKSTVRETVATLNRVLSILSFVVEDSFNIIRSGKQLFTAETNAGSFGMHSHNIYGWVSTLLKKWLLEYFESHERQRLGWPRSEVVLFPPNIVEALAMTWKAASGRKPSDMAMDGVGGYINEDERFMMCCPGNACDVAIYPDNTEMISSHNLDTPDQQLALLAGLFSLFEFIQKHPDAKSAP